MSETVQPDDTWRWRLLGSGVLAAHPDYPPMVRRPKPDGDLGPWEVVRPIVDPATIKIAGSWDAPDDPV